MRLIILALLFAFTLAVAPHVQAETVTISPSDNLGAAVRKLKPGDTLVLRGGNYGRISWQDGALPSGTSWSVPITIRGAAGETAVLKALDIGPNTGPKKKYLIFRDFTVAGAPVSAAWIGADYVRLQNLELKNYAHDGLQVGGDHNEFLNLKIHDNPRGCRCHGIYMWGSDNLIDGVEVYNNGGLGAQIFGGGPAFSPSRNIIRNSRLYNNGSSTNSGGILIADGTGNIACNNVVTHNTQAAHGIDVDYNCIDCQVLNNTIKDNVGQGINITAKSTRAIVRNNVVVNNNRGGGNVQIVNDGSGTVFSGNRCSHAGPGCESVGGGEAAPAGSSVCPGQAPPGSADGTPVLPAPRNLRLVTQP